MLQDPREASLTPRTDAAERFFHEPGRPPVGFVASGVSRVLEVELTRALAELKKHGVEAPTPLDARTHALLQSTRKPTSSIFKAAPQAPAAAQAPRPAPTPARMLPAMAATEALGEARTYEDGAPLYRLGERGEHIFILLYGQLRVSQLGDGSAERIVGPGEVFGEHALFEEGVHTETLHAVGQARCLLVRAADLRQSLNADTSVLPYLMMSLVMQYRMVSDITARVTAGLAPAKYELLGQKSLTGSELQRALLENKDPSTDEALTKAQRMCLKLQGSELMPTRLLRAGMSLGRPGEEHLGLGMMLVNGRAQIRLGEHLLQLGQGSVVGVAEGLTGQDFSLNYAALQDINARVFPLDRAIQRLDKADPLLRSLASHLCATILAQQAALVTPTPA